MTERLLRIGEVAASLGVSTRTLRYYEELGLLCLSTRTEGGARRYTIADVERVQRIRTLQTLLGFDLDRIRDLLGAEDELAALRSEFAAGVSAERQREIAARALTLYDRMRTQVRGKIAALEEFLAELNDKAGRARRVARQASVPETAGHRSG
jgi:MerR family transcriptional regulator, repressor of the yfmOP operon